MSAELRKAMMGSWWCPESRRVLGADLAARLVARCEGERNILHITLTYRREGWQNAQDAYLSSVEEQHVPLFLRRLARRCGVEDGFKGRWFRKLEFQRDGFIHFHLLILGESFIPHAALSEAWGHGFAFVTRVKDTADLAYLAKYVSKEASLPAWVLHQPIRSIRVVAVSPGFWREQARPRRESPARCDQEERSTGMRLRGVYRTIGARLEEWGSRTLVRCEETGKHRVIGFPMWSLMAVLSLRGFEFVEGASARWTGTTAAYADVVRAADDLRAAVDGVPSPTAARLRAAVGVHLIHSRQPDGARGYAWVRRVVVDALTRGGLAA